MANIKKNATGYGYKYTDLAAINDYIESIGETYYQEIERIEGDDYVVTVRQATEIATESKVEVLRVRGCRVVQASLSGKTNPAQEQGSGLTYARRYSLLMAYGLATEDDDAETFTKKAEAPKETRNRPQEVAGGAEPFNGNDGPTYTGKREDGSTVLDRAKKAINEQLISQNYITSDAKKAFIKSVLQKETIDSIEDAELVDDELANMKDPNDV